jgi:rhodanese-related sulfurtransferase
LSEPAFEKARASARQWADKVGVRILDRAAYDFWLGERDERTIYRFDVRTPEEHDAGHPEGFELAPGGQLVQATDEWVGVRGARLVLFDDDGVRARMTASWLTQMGWEVAVVENGALAADETGRRMAARPLPRDPGEAGLEPREAAKLGGDFVDLATSPVYRQGHIPGALFVAGARLHEDLAKIPGDGPIVLTSPDGALALDNLGEARCAVARPVRVLVGGTQAWSSAGFPLDAKRHSWASPPEDIYKRPYEGTDNAQAAMQAYIDWELQLVAQLANDGVSRFHVVR